MHMRGSVCCPLLYPLQVFEGTVCIHTSCEFTDASEGIWVRFKFKVTRTKFVNLKTMLLTNFKVH